MWQAIAAISMGASLGAVLRWLLSINFNTALPSLQPGTLIANLLGGYLIGIGIAYFANHSDTVARVAIICDHGISRRADHVFNIFG